MKGGGYQPVKFPASDYSWRGRGLQQWWELWQPWQPPLCTFCDQQQQWVSEHRYLENRILASCAQSAPGTHAQLPAMWLGLGGGGRAAATVLRAKIDQNSLQFTVQVFPWNLQALNSLQSSKIVTSDRFFQCDCRLGGETDSWCFLLLHLPRIPTCV